MCVWDRKITLWDPMGIVSDVSDCKLWNVLVLYWKLEIDDASWDIHLNVISLTFGYKLLIMDSTEKIYIFIFVFGVFKEHFIFLFHELLPTSIFKVNVSKTLPFENMRVSHIDLFCRLVQSLPVLNLPSQQDPCWLVWQRERQNLTRRDGLCSTVSAGCLLT